MKPLPKLKFRQTSMTAHERRLKNPLHRTLAIMGAVIDDESAIEVTAHCWGNGFDPKNIIFDTSSTIEEDYDE